jgi:hypothetical protein
MKLYIVLFKVFPRFVNAENGENGVLLEPLGLDFPFFIMGFHSAAFLRKYKLLD